MDSRTAGFARRICPVALLTLLACAVILLPSARSQFAAGSSSPREPAALMPVADGALCTQPEANGAGADLAAVLKGTDLPAIRQISDPYPTFSEVAVDPASNRVVMTDINRKSVLQYDRSAGGNSSAQTAPLSQIMGPNTMAGFLAGVALDPVRREIFAVNNDIEDSMAVFSYDSAGDAKPLRALVVPHQSWGISLDSKRDEIGIAIQQVNAVFIYRREASGVEPPIRTIQGAHTGLADPHGIFMDERDQEIIVANHGNWRNEFTEDRPQRVNAVSYPDVPSGGKFLPPSIAVYPLTANGDVKPLRVLRGASLGLNYPMALDVDLDHNEIVVANNGDNSILVFPRTGAGEIPPLRVIRGDRTGLNMPIGIAVDTKNDELWVTNSNSHTALVFPRGASGNVSPKRVIRNAPADAALVGFTNPMALGYDTKRNEILVPN
jgi:DNA-binding beta-propeller fold protein YncE